MNDSDKKTHIRNRVAAIIIKEDKILLVQHEKNDRKYWLIPGGGVEFGETLEEAAKRELQEECSLDIELGDLIFISETIPPDNHRHVINYYFEAKISGGDMKVNPDKVLRDAQWQRIEDLPHMVIYPQTTREILEWAQSKTVEKISIGNRWD